MECSVLNVILGFSTKLSFRRLSFSASFNGVSGIDRLNTNNRYINTPGTRANNLTREAFLGMWTPTNHSNSYPSSTFNVGNYTMDRYIEDASYLRCSDLTLSYSLPVRWMKKIGFNYCSLSFSVKNASSSPITAAMIPRSTVLPSTVCVPEWT